MAKIEIALCILCLAGIGGSRLPDRHLLADAEMSARSPIFTSAIYEYPETREMNRMLMGKHFDAKSRAFNRRVVYKKLIPIAEAELWVREATGRNDGKRVEEYLASVGLKQGQPYCAAFLSWVFKQAGYAAPRTGWSPDLFPNSRLVKAAAPGNVFGIYFPALKRIAHCGLVTGVQGDWVKTIEGNTNGSGGREGDGVYRRLRHKRSIKAYADWKGGYRL
ncbi:C40 family peptidase [Pedobacter sp. PWIIR3]